MSTRNRSRPRQDYGSLDSNKMPPSDYNMSIMYTIGSGILILTWLGFMIGDSFTDSGRFPGGFAALYSPPLAIGLYHMIFGAKLRSKLIERMQERQKADTLVYVRTTYVRDIIIVLSTVLLTITLLVADTVDNCVTQTGAPSCVVDWNKEYWITVPFALVILVASANFYIQSLLYSTEDSKAQFKKRKQINSEGYIYRWKYSHWLFSVIFAGCLIGAASIDIMAAAEDGQNGWTGRSTGDFGTIALVTTAALSFVHLMTTFMMITHRFMN